MYFTQETNSGAISYDKLAQQFCSTEVWYLLHSVWNNSCLRLFNYNFERKNVKYPAWESEDDMSA